MYHKIFIVGNLGRDPEMRYTPSGQAVTNMNVAANRTYKNKDGQNVKETAWFRVSTWGNLAENCNMYLKKGSKVFIECRLSPDPETGGPTVFYRNDGTAGASFEVVAQTVQFLDSKGEGGFVPVGADEFDLPPMDEIDEIPF